MKYEKVTLVAAVVSVLALSGCGGGGGGGTSSSTVTGSFVDKNVEGLSYTTSGGGSGVTGAAGTFTFTSGETIHFTLGNVDFGTAIADKAVSPIDLVAGGSSTNTAVLNRVRFLIMLDADGNADNGIQITDAIRSAAASWGAVDFTDAINFDIQPGVLDAMGSTGSSLLPTITQAQTHLESSLRCAYSGGFAGSFSGDDSGHFGAAIDPRDGTLLLVGYSNIDGFFWGYGNNSVTWDQVRSFSSGYTSNGAYFSGSMPTYDNVSGSWTNSGASASGTYSGSRINSSPTAKYRITGYYYGSDYGLFTANVGADNSVSVIGYSVSDGATFTSSATASVSGSTVTVMNANTSNGANYSITYDLATGGTTGSWSNTGASGYIDGGGCAL